MDGGDFARVLEALETAHVRYVITELEKIARLRGAPPWLMAGIATMKNRNARG